MRFLPPLIAASMLILPTSAPAAPAGPPTVFIDELTWTELRADIAAGKTTIIVPIGGTEQNGPHMTLGKHNARVTALAQRIAQALGNALVAPTLAYVPEGNVNPPSAHMRFPGTITIPDATFEKVIEYAARSFKLHGFRDIVLLGDHGDYRKSLKAVADRIDREWAATPVRVHAIDEYYVAAETLFAQALGNALVAPTLAYVPEGNVNPPSAHMRFPGTITIPEATFEKVIEYAARSFRQAGFRDIVLIGDHGGYRKSLKAVADRLDREWAATPVRVHAIDEYYVASETLFGQALRRQGYRDEEIGTHAGLADTSLAMAINPSLVRTDRLRSPEPLGRSDGVYGDPRRATAELGQPGVDLIVTTTVEAIKRAVARR